MCTYNYRDHISQFSQGNNSLIYCPEWRGHLGGTVMKTSDSWIQLWLWSHICGIEPHIEPCTKSCLKYHIRIRVQSAWDSLPLSLSLLFSLTLSQINISFKKILSRVIYFWCFLSYQKYSYMEDKLYGPTIWNLWLSRDDSMIASISSSNQINKKGM